MNAGTQELLRVYGQMHLCRTFQNKLADLRKQGLLNAHPYLEVGEEAITFGTCLGLKDTDIIHPYYRGEGAILRLRGGVTVREQMAWWLGRVGEDGTYRMVLPSQWMDVEHGIIGRTDSCLGSEVDVAVGAALAMKLQNLPHVVLTMVGEGATNKGNFHEGLTFSSTLNLPLIMVIRCNEWAMSMPKNETVPIENLSDMSASYGIPAAIVDGNDFLAVRDQVRLAAEEVRATSKPYIIEAKSYRLSPHSSNDEDNYRSDTEKKQWAEKDPLIILADKLRNTGVSEAALIEERAASEQEIESAYQWAITRPVASVSEMLAAQSAVVSKMWGR